MVEDVGGAYWTRTSDPRDVNTVLYQLSQSTKVCRRMRCIGSNIYYTAIRGGCQDRRRENFLLSVWRAAKARGVGFVPRPTPLLLSSRALSCVRARRQAFHERLLFSARTFPPPRLRTGFPRTLCCSAHAPSCACAHGQALRERLLFQHLPASRPRISPPRAPCGLSARTFPRPRPRTGSPRTLCGLSARGSFCRRSSRRRRRRVCRCPAGRGWRG